MGDFKSNKTCAAVFSCLIGQTLDRHWTEPPQFFASLAQAAAVFCQSAARKYHREQLADNASSQDISTYPAGLVHCGDTQLLSWSIHNINIKLVPSIGSC